MTFPDFAKAFDDGLIRPEGGFSFGSGKAVIMTIADEFGGKVSEALGDRSSLLWLEIRPVPDVDAVWDVWMALDDDGVQVCVSLAKGGTTVRIMCDEFTFEPVPLSCAPDFVVAVLTGDFSLRIRGRVVRSLRMTVTACGEDWIAKRGNPGQLSRWQRAHLATS